MELYLIRHGIAVEPGDFPDADRPLTDRGRAKTIAIVQHLRSLGIYFDRVLTSPLCRARQTAELLQQGELVDTVEIWTALQPGGAIQEWDEWLARFALQPAVPRLNQLSRVAIVGHEPDLSHWAEQFIWGEQQTPRPASQRLVLKKAGVIGLTLPDPPLPSLGQGQLFCLIPPRFWV